MQTNKFSHYLADEKYTGWQSNRIKTLCGKYVGLMSFDSGYRSPTWTQPETCPKCIALRLIAETRTVEG